MFTWLPSWRISVKDISKSKRDGWKSGQEIIRFRNAEDYRRTELTWPAISSL